MRKQVYFSRQTLRLLHTLLQVANRIGNCLSHSTHKAQYLSRLLQLHLQRDIGEFPRVAEEGRHYQSNLLILEK